MGTMKSVVLYWWPLSTSPSGGCAQGKADTTIWTEGDDGVLQSQSGTSEGMGQNGDDRRWILRLVEKSQKGGRLLLEGKAKGQ
jgi:hypothetical protein